LELKFYSQFKASAGQDLQSALQNKIINIEGIAIDTTVNANKWQVPEEDLPFLINSLKGAQLRTNHAEDVFQVVGKVSDCIQNGNTVSFRAEVADDRLIEKIFRGYIDAVSIQVDSNDIECSKCLEPSRKEGVLVHLCSGAWEIVHKPRVRELSIVASPAYQNTSFKPAGFAAAMDKSQNDSKLPLNGSKNGGSKGNLQEPDKKTNQTQKGETNLSANNTQQASSAQKAADDLVVNTAQDAGSASSADYDQMMKQLTDLETKINANPGASEAEMDAMKSKVSELESEVAKRANKKTMSKKLADLKKQLSESSDESVGANEDVSENSEGAAKKAKATGKGLIADEMQQPQIGSIFGNADWFKDLTKANKKLVGLQ
jgi:hypothetical protein